VVFIVLCGVRSVNIGWPTSSFASIDLPPMLTCSDKCMAIKHHDIMKFTAGYEFRNGTQMACMRVLSVVNDINGCL